MSSNVIEIENEEREFSLAERKSKAYASSAMIPQHLRDLGSMMILNQMSKDYNLPALTLAQNIFMIKGKVGMSGQLVIALINKSGMYDFDLEWEEREKPWGVRAIAYKNKRKVIGIWVDDKMILENQWERNENWRTNKDLMARYRSATYFGRLNCPAVLMGLQTDDEIIDTKLEEDTTKEIEDLNQVLTRKQEEELKEPEIEEADISEDEEYNKLMEEADKKEIEDVEETIEEEPEVQKEEEPKAQKEEEPFPQRASKEVVEKYIHFMNAGIRRIDLSDFVRYYRIDKNNVEFIDNHCAHFAEDYYNIHLDRKPNDKFVIEERELADEEIKEMITLICERAKSRV